MKPITFPLPFLGLNVRIEAAPARRLSPVRRGFLTIPTLNRSLPRRVLQDIGLDNARSD